MRNLLSILALGILTGCATKEDTRSYFPPISHETYSESQKTIWTNLPPKLMPGEKFDPAKILKVKSHPGDPKFKYTDAPELRATIQIEKKETIWFRPERDYMEYPPVNDDPNAPVPLR